MCFSTAPADDDESTCDGAVRESLGHQFEDLALPRGQMLEFARSLRSTQYLAHHFGIDRAASVGDSPEGDEEIRHVDHPVLEEVADSGDVAREEFAGVVLLHVLRQHEDRGRRRTPADLDCRAQTFVGVGGRHSDVDDTEIGLVFGDGVEECIAVTDRGDHVEARVVEQSDDAVTEEHGVVGHDRSERSSSRVGKVTHRWLRSGRGGSRRRSASDRPAATRSSVFRRLH